MNARAAKTIRRAAARLGHAPGVISALKALWYATPRPKRAGLRRKLAKPQ